MFRDIFRRHSNFDISFSGYALDRSAAGRWRISGKVSIILHRLCNLCFLGTPLALYWVFKGFKEIEQDKLSPKGFAILDICFCEFMGCITLTGLLLAIEIITHMLGVYCPEMLIKCISTSDAAIILMLFLGAGMVLFPTLIQISSIIDGYDE